MYILIWYVQAPSISYPSLDDNPPAYSEGDPAVGQLIDLGIELTALPKRSEEDQAKQQQLEQPALPEGDILQQLATLGKTCYTCTSHGCLRYTST